MPGAAKAREPSDHPGTVAGVSITGLIWNTIGSRGNVHTLCPLPAPNTIVRVHHRRAPVWPQAPESMLEMDPMLISRREDKPHARCTRWGPTQLSEFTTENRHETKKSPHKPNVPPSRTVHMGRSPPCMQNTDTGRTSLWPRREEADALFLDFGAGPCVFSSRAFGVLGPTCAFPYASDNLVPTWKRGRGANA